MAGEGQDVEVVVQEDTRVVGREAQDEPLVEPVDHVLMCLSSKPEEDSVYNRVTLQLVLTWSVRPY